MFQVRVSEENLMAVKHGPNRVSVTIYLDNATYERFKSAGERLLPEVSKWWETPLGRRIIKEWLENYENGLMNERKKR